MSKIIFHEGDLPSNFDLKASVAIDTEAMGLNNHRDRLCLVQLSFGDDIAHLVRFGNDYDAPNLKALLTNNELLKIFHYARFDLSILQHYLKIDINNIYCTKIASKIARTYTDSHGLKDLCNDLLSIKLNKSQTSTDWGQEKLTNEQMQYAADDVLYLHRIKNKLDEILARENRSKLALDVISFIKTRVSLDMLGWQDIDIFSHS